jgi:Putative MetA-pathway of phenol degradation
VRFPLRRTIPALVAAGCVIAAAAVSAQQPFVSDDAEVTDKGKWHFEYYNSYVELSRSAAPDLRQDTNNFVIQYGVIENLEANVDFPLIAIQRAPHAQLSSAFGLGDVDFALKYKLVSEKPDQVHPAFTFVMAVEVPTGDPRTQLGSGYTDVVFNTITQKTIAETWAIHLDLGYQISGNTLTGAIGIRTPGHIFAGGLSVTRIMSDTLLLGVDLNGAAIHTAHQSDGQLQLTAGGSLALGKKFTFDFAAFVGWYDSPRVGVLLGTTFSP